MGMKPRPATDQGQEQSHASQKTIRSRKCRTPPRRFRNSGCDPLLFAPKLLKLSLLLSAFSPAHGTRIIREMTMRDYRAVEGPLEELSVFRIFSDPLRIALLLFAAPDVPEQVISISFHRPACSREHCRRDRQTQLRPSARICLPTCVRPAR